MSGDIFSIAPPKLSESSLAMVGLATHYEAHAKTTLSLVLKALKKLDFNGWLEVEKRQFGDLVGEVSKIIGAGHPLRPHFVPILEQHKDLRESRNFVVHAVWGQGENGEPSAYCYRRRRTGDESDILKASNDGARLASLCHSLAYQVALRIASGEIAEGPDPTGVSMKAPDRWVRF